jgi:hypothetical protein
MPGSIELSKLLVLAILVPATVFGFNWWIRRREQYAQTAAADFILAMLIFDAAAVIASKDFEPMLRSPELAEVISYWHCFIGVLCGLAWLGIVNWGEPALEHYYRHRGTSRFPIGKFSLCWFSIFLLVALHIGFFTVKHGPSHV